MNSITLALPPLVDRPMQPKTLVLIVVVVVVETEVVLATLNWSSSFVAVLTEWCRPKLMAVATLEPEMYLHMFAMWFGPGQFG